MELKKNKLIIEDKKKMNLLRKIPNVGYYRCYICNKPLINQDRLICLRCARKLKGGIEK